jgi:hypothetical protein
MARSLCRACAGRGKAEAATQSYRWPLSRSTEVSKQHLPSHRMGTSLSAKAITISYSIANIGIVKPRKKALDVLLCQPYVSSGRWK